MLKMNFKKVSRSKRSKEPKAPVTSLWLTEKTLNRVAWRMRDALNRSTDPEEEVTGQIQVLMHQPTCD